MVVWWLNIQKITFDNYTEQSEFGFFFCGILTIMFNIVFGGGGVEISQQNMTILYLCANDDF